MKHFEIWSAELSHIKGGHLALCEQVLFLDKVRLKKKMGFVEKATDCAAICHALAVQLDMAA